MNIIVQVLILMFPPLLTKTILSGRCPIGPKRPYELRDFYNLTMALPLWWGDSTREGATSDSSIDHQGKSIHISYHPVNLCCTAHYNNLIHISPFFNMSYFIPPNYFAASLAQTTP
jgi:hypothetical protein